MSSAWSSHLGMSGFLAVARVTLAARTRARRGIVHLRRAARAVLTLVAATQSRTGEIDASPRWRAAHSAVGGQPLLRHPWSVACADVQPPTWKEQTVVSCGSPCTRNGLLSRRGACLNLLLLVSYRPLGSRTSPEYRARLNK